MLLDAGDYGERGEGEGKKDACDASSLLISTFLVLSQLLGLQRGN